MYDSEQTKSDLATKLDVHLWTWAVADYLTDPDLCRKNLAF